LKRLQQREEESVHSFTYVRAVTMAAESAFKGAAGEALYETIAAATNREDYIDAVFCNAPQ
jgi:hypothetical protein